MRTYAALMIETATAGDDAEDRLAVAFDDLDVIAVDEPEPGQQRAFFATAADRDGAADVLRSRFPGINLAPADVSDENWAERSQAALRAIRVGGLTVAPPWDSPDPEARTIVILPSMGFGTGHHATTRLCLRALQAEQPAGKRVLDVGTGSGVLALAAARLGAVRVLGVDNDDDAVANARENMALNRLAVEFRTEDLEQLASRERFAIVLANLTGATLARYAQLISALAEPGGCLILSGLREEEEKDVQGAFEAPVDSREVEEGWVCLVMRTRP